MEIERERGSVLVSLEMENVSPTPPFVPSSVSPSVPPFVPPFFPLFNNRTTPKWYLKKRRERNGLPTATFPVRGSRKVCRRSGNGPSKRLDDLR